MSRNQLIEMGIRRQQQIKQREKDPRVLMTKIIFMNTEDMTITQALAELAIDLVPRVIAEDLVAEWAEEKTYLRRRSA